MGAHLIEKRCTFNIPPIKGGKVFVPFLPAFLIAQTNIQWKK